jgi:hypothetical protein
VTAVHQRPDRAGDPRIIDGLSIRFAESAGGGILVLLLSPIRIPSVEL